MEQGPGAPLGAPAGVRAAAWLLGMGLLGASVTGSMSEARATDNAPFQIDERTMRWHGSGDEHSDDWFRANWSKGSIVMPYLTSSRKDVAMRINDELYMDVIGIPAPKEAGANFELTIPADQSALVSTSSVSFDRGRDDERIVSISMHVEGCGASCDTDTVDHHFDAGNGRPFTATEVIAPAAQVQIVKRLDREAVRQYTQMLKTLRADLKLQLKTGKPSQPGGSLEDTRSRIELNEYCLKNAIARQEDATRDLAQEFGYLNMAIPDDTGVRFNRGHCSGHASLALDDVGDLTMVVPNAQLRGWLNDYGKFLFFGGERPRPALSPFGVLLHGKIGQSPIELRIEPPSDIQAVVAVYYYDKYRLPITLLGVADGDKVRLETPKENAQTESFELVRHGAGFSGQWHRQGEQQPVSLGF